MQAARAVRAASVIAAQPYAVPPGRPASIEFDNTTGQRVKLANSLYDLAAELGTCDFTIALSVKPADTNDVCQLFSSQWNGNGWLGFYQLQNDLNVAIIDTAGNLATAVGVNDLQGYQGSWIRVVARIWRSKTPTPWLDAFINGVVSGAGADCSAVTDTLDASKDFHIGSYPKSQLAPYNGEIADVCLWRRALTAAEIWADFAHARVAADLYCRWYAAAGDVYYELIRGYHGDFNLTSISSAGFPGFEG